MKTIELDQASRSLREYALEAGEEPLVIVAGGRPAAVLIPITDADMETVSLSTNPQFLAIIERSRRRHEVEGGISSADMRRLLAEPAPAEEEVSGD